MTRLSEEEIAAIEHRNKLTPFADIIKSLLADREAIKSEMREAVEQANTAPDYENELRLRDAEVVAVASRYGWSPENPKSPVGFIAAELAAVKAELAEAKREIERLKSEVNRVKFAAGNFKPPVTDSMEDSISFSMMKPTP